MNIRRKTAALTAGLLAAVYALAGCGTAPASGGTDPGSGKKLSIVCTVFPEYDWVMQLMGDKAADAEITYLLESGIDLHNYQPTADDIIRISTCDLFIYVGGESDEWAEEAAEDAVNRDIRVVKLLDAIGSGAKTEELKEGMQEEDEEEHGDGEEDEIEYDEHVWLSLRNAKQLCSVIAGELCELDPANAESYNSNLAAYSAELDALDSEISGMTASSPVKTLVFGDRFPFRYFLDDYGLDYYAAFAGCSAETEASFETIVFLAQKMDELGNKTIYTIENSDKSVARTIIESTAAKDQQIAELNSLQSVGRADIEAGATYLSLMRTNYEVLAETLK